MNIHLAKTNAKKIALRGRSSGAGRDREMTIEPWIQYRVNRDQTLGEGTTGLNKSVC